MFSTIRRDAVELARSALGDASGRSVLRVVLKVDSFKILVLQRLREGARRWHVPLANHLLRVLETIFFAIEIDRDVTLGPGVYIVHTVGTVIGGDSRVGARVRLYGNNTLGTVRDDGYPTVEEDVWIGAGARVLGPIRIGARSRIGANAVVMCDVPPDSVAVGIPARVMPADRSARARAAAPPSA